MKSAGIHWGWMFFIGIGVVYLIASGGGDDSGSSHHPYLRELEKNAPPVIEVGNLSRCQKQVGAWVFRLHDKPFTAYNRQAVDDACAASRPTDTVEVVGAVALDETSP